VLSPFYDADALLACCGVTYIVHSTQMYKSLYCHGGCRKDIEVKLCLSVLDLMKLNSPIITPQDSEHINDEYYPVLFPFAVSSVRSCNVNRSFFHAIVRDTYVLSSARHGAHWCVEHLLVDILHGPSPAIGLSLCQTLD
jgi:hypothetical protein